MNFLYVQLSREILMLVAQDGGRMILLTQQVNKSTLPHYQLDIKKIFDKPSHVANNSMSCIDLFFCANQNTILNYGVDVSIFDKCHHDIIFYISTKPGITVKQMWKILSMQYLILIGVKLLKFFP